MPEDSQNGHNFDERTLKRMCRHFPIRPLKSKIDGSFYAFEACAGVLNDPNSGKPKKLRRAFNFNKSESVEQALADAKRWITDMKGVTRLERNAVIALPVAMRSELLYMTDLCKQKGHNLLEVLRRGLEVIEAEKISEAIIFSEAAKLTIAQKERDLVSHVYLRELRDFYRDSGNTFANRRLHEITPAEIEDWLDDQEVGPVTWNNYRRKFGVLFSFAAERRNGWVKENPIEQISPKAIKTEEVTALTVAQAKAVLAAAHREIPRLIPYLCVGMFAGLRRSEAETATWEDIDWETKSIRVKGGKMRSVTSRYVHLPPVFIDWMRPILDTGAMCTGTYARRDDLKKLRELTFDFDGNIFRHSFGTYHYHQSLNAAATIAQMGHTSTAMLFRHYSKPVPKAVAEKFWALTREAVLKDAS